MSGFAPLYSLRERVLIVSILLAVAIPIYLVGFYWIFPWLKRYAKTANCDYFGAFTGMELLLYGMFTLLPLSIALLLWLIEGRRSIRAWRLGQSPLPGEKVLRKTRYKTGAAARVRPLAVFIVIALLAGIAIHGSFEARGLAREIGPCENSRQSRADDAAAAEISGAPAAKLVKSAARQQWRNTQWQFTNAKSAV